MSRARDCLFLLGFVVAVALSLPAASQTLYYDDMVYVGDVGNGKPHGKGRMDYTNGESYTGEFFLGTFKGQGTYTWPGGQRYEGQWLQGKYHGQGRLVLADGTEYQGGWAEGLKNGDGTFRWPDGSKYSGAWLKDKRHGDGTQTKADGPIFRGQWINDTLTGKGSYRGADGSEYRGSFTGGNKNGQGVYVWPSGQRYEGGWLNNKYHGHGELIYANGDRYEGDWVNGKEGGQGKLSFFDGREYEGAFRDGRFHGLGVYAWSDGAKFEGQFRSGKRDGPGIFFEAGGAIWCQFYKNGDVSFESIASGAADFSGCEALLNAKLGGGIRQEESGTKNFSIPYRPKLGNGGARSSSASVDRVRDSSKNSHSVPSAIWLFAFFVVLAGTYLLMKPQQLSSITEEAPSPSQSRTSPSSQEIEPNTGAEIGISPASPGQEDSRIQKPIKADLALEPSDNVVKDAPARFRWLSLEGFARVIAIIPPSTLIGTATYTLPNGHGFGFDDVVATATGSLWLAWVLWPFATTYLLWRWRFRS